MTRRSARASFASAAWHVDAMSRLRAAVDGQTPAQRVAVLTQARAVQRRTGRTAPYALAVARELVLGVADPRYPVGSIAHGADMPVRARPGTRRDRRISA